MKKLTALFLASAAFLTGCSRGHVIEPPTKDGKGMESVSCVYATVFNGAAYQGVACSVDGAKLVSGERYQFGGALLVVRGDVPHDVRIDAGRAKVFVEGSLGEGVSIDASRPENFRTETIMMPMTTIGPNNTVSVTITPIYNTYSTGFKYPYDTDPVAVIAGHIGQKVKFTGNGTYTVANGDERAYSNLFAMPAVRQMMATAPTH